MNTKLTSVATVLVLTFWFIFPACAGDFRVWDNGAGNELWEDPANWDPDGYSSSDDFVFLSGEARGYVIVTDDGSITISGPDSFVTFKGDVPSDEILWVGDSGQGHLRILDAAQLHTERYSTHGTVLVGREENSEGHVILAGDGSAWFSEATLYVGYGGTGTLTVSSQTTVETTRSLILATLATGTGDVIVSGDGAAVVASTVYVGYKGSGRLTVSNSGHVSSYGGYVGHIAGAVGHSSVTGGGSTWAMVADFTVGNSGIGTVEIVDGGTVSNLDGYIGNELGAVGEVMVQGNGASWDNSGFLHVGRDGTGSLTVHNGGRVSNSTGYIGDNTTATGAVIVHGSGARWENNGTLYVGREGTGTLAIENGGAVTDQLGFIGYLGDAMGEVSVSGAGSSWNHDNYLSVGESGSGALEITGGGAVTNNDGYIGYNPTASGNAVISGVGSTWNNSSSLYVGRDGSAEMTITAGGLVSNTVGYIARNNLSVADVLISGVGSTWNNSGNLYVGSFGTATLTIQNGGAVTSSEGHVGDTAFGVGDVSVMGADSSWQCSGDLYVANSGQATLTIADGGSVTNNTGYVGRIMVSQGHVTVRGADSTWNNHSSLSVGREGMGTLQISDGGRVSNTIGYVGYIAGSSGEVTVSGAGSSWSNSGNLTVGRSGVGTLTIRDGGRVTVDGLLRLAEQSTSTGTVNFEGGSLSVPSLAPGAGTSDFQWTGGTLAVPGTGGLTLDGGLLGSVIGIHANKGLNVAGTTTVNSGVTLAVTGGEFATETLTVNGTALLRSGQITVGATFAVNPGGQLEITGQDLALLSAPTLAGALVLDQTTLSVPSLMVATSASLDLDSGLISSTGILDNQEVIRMGTTGAATLRALQLRNSGAVLGRGVFHAELSNQGNVGISGDSSFTEDVANQSGAKIIISGGAAATFFEDVDNQSGAEIRVSQDCSATYFGRLSGPGSYTGTGTSYIEGDLRPGSSPGIMAFDGDVVLGPFSSVEFELTGLTPGSGHDQLGVASEVSLAGTLQLQPLPPYVDPIENGTVDTFAIILAGNLEGGFDEVTYDGTLLDETSSSATSVRSYQGDGLFRVFEYFDDGVVYSNYRALGGDANGDGTVDGQDFIIWNANKFTSGTDWITGDFTGDGITDGQDFILWNQNKFTSVPGLAAYVPEPQCWVLLILCWAATALNPRR